MGRVALSRFAFALTERALSTLPTDDSGKAQEKSRFSTASDDDDDVTFDRCGIQ